MHNSQLGGIRNPQKRVTFATIYKGFAPNEPTTLVGCVATKRILRMSNDLLIDYLGRASVAPEVFELRPDYRCLLIAVEGISPAPSDEFSEALLVRAEKAATIALNGTPVEELPHIVSWREAFSAFGAKPNRTRNSAEALIRRASGGLPRINRLTDIYNALSVIHQVPFGGEDLAKYQGAPKLVRASGAEVFDTTADGELITENPELGEVVWCDDAGVTCRRWNWRQGKRTQLTDEATSALFILDALDPISSDELIFIGNELIAALQKNDPNLLSATRLISNQS
jgi:DNA/RNA-binding domain of Phe-tRNA-synthetase-like protein